MSKHTHTQSDDRDIHELTLQDADIFLAMQTKAFAKTCNTIQLDEIERLFWEAYDAGYSAEEAADIALSMLD